MFVRQNDKIHDIPGITSHFTSSSRQEEGYLKLCLLKGEAVDLSFQPTFVLFSPSLFVPPLLERACYWELKVSKYFRHGAELGEFVQRWEKDEGLEKR